MSSSEPHPTTSSTNGDSEHTRHELRSLLVWLCSFSHFTEISIEENHDPAELIGQEHIASAILHVTQEVFSVEVPPNKDEIHENKTWTTIFNVIATQDPSVRQQFTPALAKVEQRVLLLSAMLCHAVTCPERKRYIGQIVNLSRHDQLVLMAIIERGQQDDQGGNVHTSSSQSSPAPGSSPVSERRRSTSSRRSARTSSKGTLSSPKRRTAKTPEVRSGMERQQEIDALIAWLGTFPEMSLFENKDWKADLTQTDVARSILTMVQAISGDESFNEKPQSNTSTWDLIERLVSQLVPFRLHPVDGARDSAMQRQYNVLLAILYFSVSDSCEERTTIIGRIMELPRDLQHQLMKLIELSKKFASPLSTAPGDESASQQATPLTGCSRSRSHLCLSPSGYTPPRKMTHVDRLSPGCMFSPATIDSSLEKMVKELQKEKEALRSELNVVQGRETDLTLQVHAMKAQFREEAIKLESSALQREEETREEYETKLAAIQQELNETRSTQDLEKKAGEELSRAKEELELMEHTKTKLAETEIKLQNCRERIEELGDAKDALNREEKAHSASVEECLRLENELKALQPLRRQLEDYKSRAINAEVKLAERQEDLKRMEQASLTMSSEQQEILRGVRLQQDETAELRQRLTTEELTERKLEAHAVADGLSELNPAVKEEMLRLRNENRQLRTFAAEREDDSVQKMAENLEDAQRLSEKYKEEFLATKSDLERTRDLVSQSKQRETELHTEVEDLTSKLKHAECLLHSCKETIAAKASEISEKTLQITAVEHDKKNLLTEVKELGKRMEDLEVVEQTRAKLLETANASLDVTSKSLEESHQHVEMLEKEVTELTRVKSETETALSQLRTQYEGARLSLEANATELESSRQRESSLEKAKAVLNSKIVDVRDEMEELRQVHSEEMKSTADEMSELRLEMDKLREEEVGRVKTTMTAELEHLQESHRSELITFKEEYAQLKAAADAELAAITEKFKGILASSADQHDQELADLVNESDAKIEEIRTRATEEHNQLMEKGKKMLKEKSERSEKELRVLSVQVDETKEILEKVQSEFAVYQKQTREKVGSYKRKIQFASGRIEELNTEVETLQDSVKMIERQKFKVQEENERFRRQLGGRFGADGQVQNQLEMLQKEFNAVLDENRQLKKYAGETGVLSRTNQSDSAGLTYGARLTTGASTRGSTLSQLRKEFEDTIEALNDEKRELVMKNSAAMTDVQKAEARTWELEKEVARLKQEITSLNLAVQRAEKSVDQDYALADKGTPQELSYHTCDEADTKENSESMNLSSPSQLLIDMDTDAIDSDSLPTVSRLILSPSTKPNIPSTGLRESSSTTKSSFGASEIRREDVTAKRRRDSQTKEKKDRSLMELTRKGAAGTIAGENTQQECKQS